MPAGQDNEPGATTWNSSENIQLERKRRMSRVRKSCEYEAWLLALRYVETRVLQSASLSSRDNNRQ